MEQCPTPEEENCIILDENSLYWNVMLIEEIIEREREERRRNFLGLFESFEYKTTEEISDEKSMNKNPSNEQNVEIAQTTEINNFNSDSPKKPFPFTVSHYSNEKKETKINSNSCEDFDYLRKNDTKPDNNFLNKKKERDDNEKDINQEIISQIESNKNNIIKDNFINEGKSSTNGSNLMNSVLKPFCRSLVEYIKDIGNIQKKLKIGNLSRIFHGAKYIRKVLNLPLFQLICFQGCEKNYEILKKAKPNKKNKILYEKVLNKKLKELFKCYNNKSLEFDISDNEKTIKFPKIDEVIKKNLKNRADKNITISNIKLMANIILNDFKHPIFDERQPNGKNNIDIDSMPIKKIERFEIQEENQEDELTNSEEKLFQESLDFFDFNQKKEEGNEQEERIMSKVEDYHIKIKVNLITFDVNYY